MRSTKSNKICVSLKFSMSFCRVWFIFSSFSWIATTLSIYVFGPPCLSLNRILSFHYKLYSRTSYLNLNTQKLLWKIIYICNKFSLIKIRVKNSKLNIFANETNFITKNHTFFKNGYSKRIDNIRVVAISFTF